MYNFTYFYDKLLNFYGVKNLKGLSEVTGIPISTISSIKQRESITALKKKCRELGIYNEIFGEQLLTTPLTNFSKSLEKKSYIDEDSLFFLEGLFLRAKTQNRLKELKEDIQRLSLNYLN